MQIVCYLSKSSFISLMQRLLQLATMPLNFRKALPSKMADCTSEEIENDDESSIVFFIVIETAFRQKLIISTLR